MLLSIRDLCKDEENHITLILQYVATDAPFIGPYDSNRWPIQSVHYSLPAQKS